jgi:hypothetical protein
MYAQSPVLKKPFFSEQLLDLVERLINPGADILPLRQRN